MDMLAMVQPERLLHESPSEEIDLNIAPLECGVIRKHRYGRGLDRYCKPDHFGHFAGDRACGSCRPDERQAWMPVRHKDFVETRFAGITPVAGRPQGADDAFSVLFALRSIEDQHKISIVVGVVSDACPRIFDRRERLFDGGMFEAV